MILSHNTLPDLATENACIKAPNLAVLFVRICTNKLSNFSGVISLFFNHGLDLINSLQNVRASVILPLNTLPSIVGVTNPLSTSYVPSNHCTFICLNRVFISCVLKLYILELYHNLTFLVCLS